MSNPYLPTKKKKNLLSSTLGSAIMGNKMEHPNNVSSQVKDCTKTIHHVSKCCLYEKFLELYELN